MSEVSFFFKEKIKKKIKKKEKKRIKLLANIF